VAGDDTIRTELHRFFPGSFVGGVWMAKLFNRVAMP
jgi:hypothetical protein